jgi:hypothetical protein
MVAGPPVTPAVLRSVRILRLVRLFRFAPLVRSVFTVQGIEYAGFLRFVPLVAGGQAFASPANRPLSDGLNWAISTMTTVGCGDVAAKPRRARLLAAGVTLLGIGFVAVVTGAIAQRFAVSEDTIIEGRRETSVSGKSRMTSSMPPASASTRSNSDCASVSPEAVGGGAAARPPARPARQG